MFRDLQHTVEFARKVAEHPASATTTHPLLQRATSGRPPAMYRRGLPEHDAGRRPAWALIVVRSIQHETLQRLI